MMQLCVHSPRWMWCNIIHCLVVFSDDVIAVSHVCLAGNGDRAGDVVVPVAATDCAV